MTDPIVFSYEEYLLGNNDWGIDGTSSWMKNHKCNEICKLLPKTVNACLTEKLMEYAAKIKGKAFEQKIYEELRLITED